MDELSFQLGDLTIRISKRTDTPSSETPVHEAAQEAPAHSGALAGSLRATYPASQAGQSSSSVGTWSLVGPSTPPPWTEDWEAAIISAVTPEAVLQLDLSPVRRLLSRIRTTSNGWTPLARLGRALRAGIEARQKLDTGYAAPGSTSAVTLPTKIYLVLRPAPGGQAGWTEDFNLFARQVRAPNSNLHPQSVSHGFPSRAEAEAFLLGARREWPRGRHERREHSGSMGFPVSHRAPARTFPGASTKRRWDWAAGGFLLAEDSFRWFMVVLPSMPEVAEFLEHQEVGEGSDPFALYETFTEMETSRGRRLGSERRLLVDLVWDLAPMFTRAHSLRSASFEIRKFVVSGTVARTKSWTTIPLATTSLGSPMEWKFRSQR